MRTVSPGKMAIIDPNGHGGRTLLSRRIRLGESWIAKKRDRSVGLHMCFSWIDHRASRPVAGSYLQQRRQIACAFRNAKVATRLERTSGGNRMHGRHGAFDSCERSRTIRFQRGHGIQKSTSVGMRGGMKDFALGSQFQRLPAYITAMRSATWETTARSCEMNSMARPNLSRNSASSSRICA